LEVGSDRFNRLELASSVVGNAGRLVRRAHTAGGWFIMVGRMARNVYYSYSVEFEERLWKSGISIAKYLGHLV
jgi:hypothetical protein